MISWSLRSFMKIILVIFSLLSVFSCSSPGRNIAALREYRYPSAESLFLRGKVEVQKRKNHPFDENHLGEDVDLSERRPIVWLDKTIFGEKYGKPGYKLVGNFYHHEKFWIVRIPDSSVDKVYVHFSFFPPLVAKRYIAAHALLRFKMKDSKPIEIVAPMPTLKKALAQEPLSEPRDTSLPENRIFNLAISGEAQWSQQDQKKSYDLVRGKNNAYVQITRFMSIHQRMWDFLASGNPLSQVEIQNIDEPDKVLTTSLQVSQRDGIKRRYDLLAYNCTTTVFDILEESTGRSDKRFNPLVKYMERRVPIFSTRKLKEYGGIVTVSPLKDPTLRKEWKQVYERQVVNKRKPLCTSDVIPQHCKNTQQAIDLIRAW